jgi:hypothetical protein
MPQDIEPLVQATLSDLDTDDCDLLWVFDGIRRLSPGASYGDNRRSTLRVIDELIGRGLAEAHLLGETFVRADPSKPVVEQIDHGWDRYGEALNMGDVAYFTITPAGRAEAKPWPA